MTDILERLRGIRDDFSRIAAVPLADPYVIVELRALGERAGYGNVMLSASALWRSNLGELAGGEFVCGPCRKTIENSIVTLDEATAHIAAQNARIEALEGALRKARGFVDAWPKGIPISYQREVLAAIDAALGGEQHGG